ncbi:molybdopterin-dependent oxidoreductase [Streptomyces yunnanensis]|uniref:molybdopterin-dependent oxidoreductase n=1 Tax=Streptomyces yunnanensis TaxID=156453 RepID=UPI003B82D0A6
MRCVVVGTEPLPPGQRRVRGWPVSHYGPVPRFRQDTWRLQVFGATASGTTYAWTLDEIAALPTTTITTDLHCASGTTSGDHEFLDGTPTTRTSSPRRGMCISPSRESAPLGTCRAYRGSGLASAAREGLSGSLLPCTERRPTSGRPTPRHIDKARSEPLPSLEIASFGAVPNEP